MTAGALAALAASIALLIGSLFTEDGLRLVWLSVLADALAITLLSLALAKRRPGRGAPPPG